MLKKIKEGCVTVFFYYIIIGFVEETLEDLIAYTISEVLLKGFSTFITVISGFGAKMAFKKIIKSITYKEGNDKLKKLKSFIDTLWQNKGTIGGIVTAGLAVVSGTGVIDVSALPQLLIGTFNLTPWLYYGVIGVVGAWCAFFPESKEAYEKRIAEKKANKEAKEFKKIARKEIVDEDKKANQTQAQKEKAEAKEAKAKIVAEKEKAKAEAKAEEEKAKREKIDKIKADMRKEQNKTDIPNA